MSDARNGGNGAAAVRRLPADRFIDVTCKETKHERFLRLAPGRVQRALDALNLVARLSIPENEYSEHEMRQIVSALRDQVDEVERCLSRQKPEKKVFAFDFEAFLS